ncbi:hypothetical protein [Streptomyces sp. HPF1205]|uniref:hypothetical protein n=1 Tax=Streptomyces sp. HPF1205 TaxID=2873262 RepID=UPI001CEC6536|nr:hypothetical protein [Streptomyces sp. HPF1205]
MLTTAAASPGKIQACVAGLLVFGVAVAFGFRQSRRIIALRTRGCTAPVTRFSGVWAEFHVPDQGAFTCYRGDGRGGLVRADKPVILYDPKNPKNCEFLGHEPGWPMAIVLFVLASAAAVMCIVLIAAITG